MRPQLTVRSKRKLCGRILPSTNFMKYWVYIIKDRKNNELYYGYTNDLERRLKEHKVDRRWKFIGCEGYASELDARNRERKLKQYGQSRTHLKNRLKRSLES